MLYTGEPLPSECSKVCYSRGDRNHKFTLMGDLNGDGYDDYIYSSYIQMELLDNTNCISFPPAGVRHNGGIYLRFGTSGSQELLSEEKTAVSMGSLKDSPRFHMIHDKKVIPGKTKVKLNDKVYIVESVEGKATQPTEDVFTVKFTFTLNSVGKGEKIQMDKDEFKEKVSIISSEVPTR
jgi:hypothetical protein